MITGILVLMMCECYNNKKLNALLLELHIWNIYWENNQLSNMWKQPLLYSQTFAV